MSKQIYAWTGPTPGDGYARFIQIFDEVGIVRVVVRDGSGETKSVMMPRSAFKQMIHEMDMEVNNE